MSAATILETADKLSLRIFPGFFATHVNLNECFYQKAPGVSSLKHVYKTADWAGP